MPKQKLCPISSTSPLFLKVGLLAVVAINCTLICTNPCLALSFDMNDDTSSQSAANSSSQNATNASAQNSGSGVNVNLSGGTGIGQNGADKGNTNVTFSDFGDFTHNSYPGGEAKNPADLLPINQQNVTSTGLPINSYQSQGAYQGGTSQLVNGTSPTQAPTGQVSLYPGSRGSLPPVNTALQATLMRNAFLPITSGKKTDYQHYSFGFQSTPFNLYQGPYGQPIPIPTPGGSIGLGNSNSLPPTSLGSVDFNIRSK